MMFEWIMNGGVLIGEKIDGTLQYYGIGHDFTLSAETLRSEIGLVAGAIMTPDPIWLKFIDNGVTKYITKTPVCHSVSWNALAQIGAVDGSSTIVVGAETYRVRLFSTALAPAVHMTGYDRENTHGSEWNRLMYRLSDGVEQTVTSEEPFVHFERFSKEVHGFSNIQDGHWTICQESPTNYTSDSIARGYRGVSYASRLSKGESTTRVGWRPVLELVE